MIDYTKMDNVIQKLDKGADSVLDLAQTQEDLHNAIAAMENTVNAVNSVKTELNNLNSKQSIIEQQQTETNNRLAAIEQQQTETNNRLVAIEQQQIKHNKFVKASVLIGVGAAILSCLLSIIALCI